MAITWWDSHPAMGLWRSLGRKSREKGRAKPEGAHNSLEFSLGQASDEGRRVGLSRGLLLWCESAPHIHRLMYLEMRPRRGHRINPFKYSGAGGLS